MSDGITVTLTKDEFSLVLSAVGAILAAEAQADIVPGQPAPPQILMMEALQEKLMALEPKNGGTESE
jgi:hypothetical protein